jgi:predicted KAP-like P-loop ATPase
MIITTNLITELEKLDSSTLNNIKIAVIKECPISSDDKTQVINIIDQILLTK